MTEEQEKDLERMFRAMGNSGGRFVIGQVIASQTNFIGTTPNRGAKKAVEPEIVEEDFEEQQPEEDEKEVLNDDDLIAKLKPIFYNNEENIRLFLKTIKGMKQNDITDLVNKWVADKLISDYGISRKGVLWSILNDAGLYTRTKQNWCRRVF